MKFVEPRPFADPEAAARKLLEIANATEAVQDGRIHIERINGPFLYEHKGSLAEYKAGFDLAIAKLRLRASALCPLIRLVSRYATVCPSRRTFLANEAPTAPTRPTS